VVEVRREPTTVEVHAVPVAENRAPAQPEAIAPIPSAVRPRGLRNASSDDDGSTSLRAERAALDVARTALARGQPSAALHSLETHAQRFPRGQLAEERESLAVQALVAQGEFGAARERAVRFGTRFPNSLFRPVIEASIRTIP
jgi:hypothetical protein